MTFANSLNPDQDRQNVFFLRKSQQMTTQVLKNYPACMQHYTRAGRCSFESYMIANYDFTHITPGRRQSKTLLTIDERRSKIDRTLFSIAICRAPQNAAFDQGHHCLLISWNRNEKDHQTTLKIEMEWSNCKVNYFNNFSVNGYHTIQRGLVLLTRV